MIHLRWCAALLLTVVTAGTAAAQSAASSENPRLVVVISVDQLRTDLLERYDRFFTGGFRTLLDAGAFFPSVHDYAATETGPGHATLATGTLPAKHGIVGNEWAERTDSGWVWIYNVQDLTSPLVGAPQERGVSPRNLMREGLADWLLSANPTAKVVSLAGKDRSAVLLAGKARGEVYWFHAGAGRFVTSAYYGDAEAGWVRRFNERTLPALLDSVWTNSAPAAARALARPDTASYEMDGVNTFFPHRYWEEGGRDGLPLIRWAARTPIIDKATLELAEDAVAANGLGRDAVTDLLALGLSQTDVIGHGYGPLSQEQLDNLLRLDHELGEFFRFLDQRVGKGRWVAALSADHGVVTMPEWLAAQGQPGRRVTGAERSNMIEIARAAAAEAPAGREAAAVAAAVRKLPFIADAYTFEEIARGVARDSFMALFRRSYYPGRFTSDLGPLGVEYRPTEGTYIGAATGTSHGTPYYYDRSVPLIFYGSGVRPRRGTRVARTVDLAPTLASLAGIRVPGDLDGRVLPVGGTP